MNTFSFMPMNSVTISLGSNSPDKETLLTLAMGHIAQMVVCSTPAYIDENQHYKNPYLNIVARLETELDYESLNKRFKELEIMMGRKKGSRNDDPVALDIDIVIFNDTVMRARDLNSSYFKMGLDMLP